MRYSFLLLLFVALGCSRTEEPTFERQFPFRFSDGFETETPAFEELFPADNSRWTDVQLQHPPGGDNEIGLTDREASEGGQSLRILSRPGNELLSKVDIEKQGFFAPQGSTVTISADFFLQEGADLAEVFLIDVECCSCWDPEVANNPCPGVRLKLRAGNFLAVERAKILRETIGQTRTALPTNRWVTVEWTMTLHADIRGVNRVAVDGETVIGFTGQNLPDEEDFRVELARHGIFDFEFEEPLGYERVQVGVTANPTAQTVELLVDNFSITVE